MMPSEWDINVNRSFLGSPNDLNFLTPLLAPVASTSLAYSIFIHFLNAFR